MYAIIVVFNLLFPFFFCSFVVNVYNCTFCYMTMITKVPVLCLLWEYICTYNSYMNAGSKSINMVKPFRKIYVQQDNHFSEANTLYSNVVEQFSVTLCTEHHLDCSRRENLNPCQFSL